MAEGLGPWGVLSSPAGVLLHIKTIYPIPLMSFFPLAFLWGSGLLGLLLGPGGLTTHLGSAM